MMKRVRADRTAFRDGVPSHDMEGGERTVLELPSMRARVERLGGVLTIRSQPGAGTTVAVRVDSREDSHAIS
jgi:nitrate/nitrite-specific signal transduction histidine kinase